MEDSNITISRILALGLVLYAMMINTALVMAILTGFAITFLLALVFGYSDKDLMGNVMSGEVSEDLLKKFRAMLFVCASIFIVMTSIFYKVYLTF